MLNRKEILLASRDEWNTGDIVKYVSNVPALDCDNPEELFDTKFSYLICEVDKRPGYDRLNFYGIPGWYNAACFYNTFYDHEI